MQVLYEPSIRSLTLKDVNDNEMSLYEIPKGIRFLYIESGELQTLTVPDGVIEVHCEFLGLRDLHLPESLEDLFCRRNNLINLELPSGTEYVDARSNQLSSITWKSPPKNIATMLLCRNNLRSLLFDTPESMHFICLCDNPIENASMSVYKLFKSCIQRCITDCDEYDSSEWVGHTGEWQAAPGVKENITDKCCINWSYCGSDSGVRYKDPFES